MATSSPLSTPLPWDLVSSAYADEVTPMFEPYARDALRLAGPPPGSRIVDVACGPGTLSVLAAQAGHAVEALDFSSGMLERFEARRLTLGLDTIAARQGDGQALPYDDGAFAAGFSMFGLMFFPDRARGLAELRRVLAPGARAVISSWLSFEDHPVFTPMFGALREALVRVLGPDAPPPGPAGMALSTAELCRAEMSEAFADVEVHRIVHTERYDSARDLWASLQRTMAPLVLLRRGLGEDRWSAVAAAAQDAVIAALDDRPAVVEMPAWLTVGVAR